MARARTPTIDIKVLAPVHLREGVPRAHLLTTIERQQPRILCVIAPAGYGKTKLLSQWAYRLRENGSSVAWLSLDEKDRNPRRFLAHFLHTIERGDPTIADHLPAATASAVNYAGANSSFAALPALPLADFLYERSRIEEAQRLIQVYLDKATTLGTVDQLIGGYVTAMRLASKGGAKNNEPKRGVSRRSAPGALIEPLKRREREILERISEGMTNG